MAPHEDHPLIQALNNSSVLKDEKNESNVLIAKGVTMIVLCSVSTCMGILPMQLAKWLNWNTKDASNPRSTRLVSLLLGFGGGVLFCTTFLHLLPEVTESVEHLTEEGKLPKLPFSLAEALTCAGFFIMYLVEESVHTHLRNKQSQRDLVYKKDINRSTNELVENGQSMTSINGIANGHSHAHGHAHGHGHSHLPPVIINDDDDDFVISSLRGLLIVLGLSVHELFEGLAIGLESSASFVWYMFAAVAAHKFVIAFCIGVELIASKTRRYLAIIYVCTFAIVSPLGIGIGMLLVGGGSAAASGPLAVILQGLASGTLLYVVFFEILQEHRSGLKQYLSILVGFVLMFGLQMLTAHSHSHSHGGHGHSHGHDEDHNHSLEHDLHNEDDEDHDHNLAKLHRQMKAADGAESLLSDAIDRVTDSIAEAVSQALTSTTLSSNTGMPNESTTLRNRNT